MNFGRRAARLTEERTDEPAEATTAELAGQPVGKGRPTPKRRDAERRRRQPVIAPKTRREAYKQGRAQSREERTRMRQALRTGDERNLPPRDAGPVRRHVRDIVDARRNAASYVLVVLLAFVVLSIPPVPLLHAAITFAYPVALVLIIADSVLLVRRIRARVGARFPGEPTRGLGGYGVMRAMQVRRLRMPPPKVRVGERV